MSAAQFVHRPTVDVFLRRMVWRTDGRPEPIVMLLGPPGSGRSTVLLALSQECGGTIVHANLDFARPEGEDDRPEMDSNAAVAVTAFEMMRNWNNLRRGLTFHRVGLCLLALNERLDQNRGTARNQINSLIRQYVRNTPGGRAASAVENTVDVVVDVVGNLGIAGTSGVVDVVRDRAKPVIGALLQTAARRGVRSALRWHSTLPEVESADALDSLISLSRSDRRDAPSRLLDALLADIDDNVRHNPPMRSSCRCLVPPDVTARHDHAWVLLVDNADTPGGQRFLANLAEARSRWAGLAVESKRVDPLLVVGVASRWHSEWNPWWIPPWQLDALSNTKQRPVPLLSVATQEHWARHNADVVAKGGDTTAAWYPVWVDPLDSGHTREVVSAAGRRSNDRNLVGFAHRLSAGHAGAVRVIADRATAEAATVRSALLFTAGDGADTVLWEEVARTLQSVLAYPERPWVEVPDVMVAAAYLADPWRLEDRTLPEGFPNLPTTLAVLRENLWTNTFVPQSRLREVTHGDGAARPVLHPWLASCLFAGLATETVAGNGPDERVDAWEHLFSRLRDSVAGPTADPERRLFYDLALGDFVPVAFTLAERFDDLDHRRWIAALDNVTSAPSRLLVRSGEEALYRELMGGLPARPTKVQATVAKLVAALWLHRDPLVSTTVRWDREVRDALTNLEFNSIRTDVSALQEAAVRFR